MPHDAPPAASPTAPQPSGGPAATWEHHQLYQNVTKTLYALPEEFTSSLRISDFRATDIFTLNSALGASIEDSVVTGLNSLRQQWDPDGKYSLYRFHRQAQAFPDVRLITQAPGQTPILMGIELKGWFALSKEGEPTFRYTITPKACQLQDLLVVFPWTLSDVVAGSPKLLQPFVGEARYAAELRNYYWEHIRTPTGGDMGVTLASHQTPYPAKADQCSDRPNADPGNNFGRIARYGSLDEFVKGTVSQELSGIPIKAWLAFFKIFNDSTRTLEALVGSVETRFYVPPPQSQTTLTARVFSGRSTTPTISIATQSSQGFQWLITIGKLKHQRNMLRYAPGTHRVATGLRIE